METFYIVQLTSWTGDGIKPIAGPMSREEAEAQRDSYPYVPGDGEIGIMRCGHARAVNRAWLAKHAGFTHSSHGEARLIEYLDLAKTSPPVQIER